MLHLFKDIYHISNFTINNNQLHIFCYSSFCVDLYVFLELYPFCMKNCSFSISCSVPAGDELFQSLYVWKMSKFHLIFLCYYLTMLWLFCFALFLNTWPHIWKIVLPRIEVWVAVFFVLFFLLYVVLYCSLFITLITLSSVHCFWQNFLSLFLSLSLSFFFPMNNVLPTHPHSTGCFYNFLFITSLEQFDYFVPLCSFLHICCPKFSINSLDGWVYNFHCLEIF